MTEPSFTGGAPDGTVCSFAEEAQNFANWYTYYRTRLFAAIAVTAEALSQLTAANSSRDQLRLAYGSINYFPLGPDPYAANPNQTRLPSSLVADGAAGVIDNFGTLVRGVRPFLEGSTDRQQVFNWLFSLRTIGATPNREVIDSVGRYFTRTDSVGPWGDNPGTGGGRAVADHVPCRRSYLLLMTDGEWTNNTNASATQPSQPRLEDTSRQASTPLAAQASSSTIFNARGNAGPGLTGAGAQSNRTFQYSPAPAFAVTGDPTGTLTDAAVYYWSRDLRPDLINNIPPSPSNEAFWQSMSTFIVGLGIAAPQDTATTRTAIAANSSLTWPAVNTTAGVITDFDTSPVNCKFDASTNPSGCGRRDDTFRAAMISRGDFLTAADVSVLAIRVSNALATIASVTGAGAAPATTRSRVQAGDRVFVPSFQTNDWYGDLKSYDAVTYVDQLSAGGALTATPQWSANFPAWASRRIFTATDAGTGKGATFDFGSLTAAQQAQVGSVDVVNYVRGDASRESAGAQFRRRNGRLLGDIVNSDPIYSKANDFGYSASRSPAAAAGNGSTYPAFVSANRSSRRGAVYVGANAGMLHAFDAGTGEELFGYVPRAALPQLRELTWPTYVHKYFVDGPVVQGDVYWSGAWRTVVVGTSGAGPKSVFALDVTNPASVTENGRSAFSASNVLWDLSGADNDDLGNITEPGFIASGKDGNWYYFVGNGWESKNDKARLLAINLQTGSVRSIATDSAGGTSPERATLTSFTDRTNGLGGVTPVYDANRNVVAVYAGDRLGRLWKFDLSSTDPANWKVATDEGKPLFEAIDADNKRQPITAAPRITLHPAFGNMIVFGTGKLYDGADKSDLSVQTVYAVWEKPGDNKQIAASRTAQSMRKLTLKDVDPPAGSPAGTRKDRVIDDEEKINWNTDAGWYFDLSTPSGEKGERLLSSPSDVGGFVQFATFSPKNEGDPCAGGGTSYFYRLAVANNLSTFTPAFKAPRSADVIGVAILPTLEARMITKAPQTTTLTSKNLTSAQLAAALKAPAASSGSCPPGTFNSIAGVPGMTPVAVNCLAPPLRVWRELPRGPR